MGKFREFFGRFFLIFPKILGFFPENSRCRESCRPAFRLGGVEPPFMWRESCRPAFRLGGVKPPFMWRESCRPAFRLGGVKPPFMWRDSCRPAFRLGGVEPPFVWRDSCPVLPGGLGPPYVAWFFSMSFRGPIRSPHTLYGAGFTRWAPPPSLLFEESRKVEDFYFWKTVKSLFSPVNPGLIWLNSTFLFYSFFFFFFFFFIN